MSIYYSRDFVGATGSGGLYELEQMIINTSNDLILYVDDTSNLLTSNIDNTSNELIMYIDYTSNLLASNIGNNSNEISSNIINTSNEILQNVSKLIYRRYNYDGFFTSELTNSIGFGTSVNGNGDSRTIIHENGELWVWKEYNLNPAYQLESWNVGGLALPGVERGGWWNIKEKIEDIYMNLYNINWIKLVANAEQLTLLEAAVAGIQGELFIGEAVLLTEGLGGLSISSILIKLVREKINKDEAYQIISSSNIDSSNYTDAKIADINTTIQGDITTIQGDITTIQGDITTIQGDITTIQGDITTNTQNIATNTQNIATIQGDITTIQGDITATIQGDITTIQGDITTIQDDIITSQIELTAKIDNLWLSSTDIVYNLGSNIGIHTSNPLHELEVIGKIQTRGLIVIEPEKETITNALQQLKNTYFLHRIWIAEKEGLKNYGDEYYGIYYQGAQYSPQPIIYNSEELNKYVCKFYNYNNTTNDGVCLVYKSPIVPAYSASFSYFSVGANIQLDVSLGPVKQRILNVYLGGVIGSYLRYYCSFTPITGNYGNKIQLEFGFDYLSTIFIETLNIDPVIQHLWIFNIGITNIEIYCDGVKVFETNIIDRGDCREIWIAGKEANEETITIWSDVFCLINDILSDFGTKEVTKLIQSLNENPTTYLYGKTYIENLNVSSWYDAGNKIFIHRGNSRPVF